jgi:hypothetical protein
LQRAKLSPSAKYGFEVFCGGEEVVQAEMQKAESIKVLSECILNIVKFPIIEF